MAWAAIVIPSLVVVAGGIGGVLWRLGGLFQKVDDVETRVGKIETTLNAQEYRARSKGESPTVPPAEQ